MSATLTMPSFKATAAALRKTTEWLARELVQSSATPPDWNEFEWAVAQAVAAMQGISALLANRLRWSGPPFWHAFLAGQQEQSQLRHAAIGALLERIDDAVRSAGLSAVALKGAALRKLDLYAAGERSMSDVDLLVCPSDLASIEATLAELDYVVAYTTRRHAVLEPRVKFAPRAFGEHADHPLRIEVHTAVAESLPVRKVDITASLLPGPLHPGLNAYPTLAALMLHLLLHAAGNIRANALRQIQLYDIAALGHRLSDADWMALLLEPGTQAIRWWVYPALALAARYRAGSIPREVLRQARTGCSRHLRFATDRKALTDVSWSNLRIHALPGIAWSRTPVDAARYVRSRLLPSRVALCELEHTRDAQPDLYQIPWYGVSHTSRILRWLFSRPPRVQTMVSVRYALESTACSQQ